MLYFKKTLTYLQAKTCARTLKYLFDIYWESAKKYGNMDFKVILNR